MAKRELASVAQGRDKDGVVKDYYVYRHASGFHISGPGPVHYQHLCHSTVTTHEHAEGEIRLVFGVEVIGTKSAAEINAELNSHKERIEEPQNKAEEPE